MTCTLSFFSVGNGDMTLLELESGRKVLIDLNIRVAADDPDGGSVIDGDRILILGEDEDGKTNDLRRNGI